VLESGDVLNQMRLKIVNRDQVTRDYTLLVARHCG